MALAVETVARPIALKVSNARALRRKKGLRKGGATDCPVGGVVLSCRPIILQALHLCLSYGTSVKAIAALSGTLS
jgi:hypothetical protein